MVCEFGILLTNNLWESTASISWTSVPKPPKESYIELSIFGSLYPNGSTLAPLPNPDVQGKPAQYIVSPIVASQSRIGFFGWLAIETTNLYFVYTNDNFRTFFVSSIGQNAFLTGTNLVMSAHSGDLWITTVRPIQQGGSCLSDPFPNGCGVVLHSSNWGSTWQELSNVGVGFRDDYNSGGAIGIPTSKRGGGPNTSNDGLQVFIVPNVNQSLYFTGWNGGSFNNIPSTLTENKPVASEYSASIYIYPKDGSKVNLFCHSRLESYFLISNDGGQTFSAPRSHRLPMNEGSICGTTGSSQNPNLAIIWGRFDEGYPYTVPKSALLGTTDRGATWVDLWGYLNSDPAYTPADVLTNQTYASPYPDQPWNDASPNCPISSAGTINTDQPVELRHGEKTEEVTDLTIATSTSPLDFTRHYRQTRLWHKDFQFMGSGWTHNHNIQLKRYTYHEDGVSAPTYKVVVQLSNGGEAHFKQTAPDKYEGYPGVNSSLEWGGSQYILTASDKSLYKFDVLGRLITRRWLSEEFPGTYGGETWTYTYNDAQTFPPNVLVQIQSDFGPKLVFRYRSAGDAHAGKLYRVGDQTFDDTIPLSPTGRYVEFNYALNKVERNGQIFTGNQSLLTEVKDVRSNTWTYQYYGQSVGETNIAQLNFLKKVLSPAVDSSGTGLQQIVLKNLSYDTTLTELAQNGGMETSSAGSVLNWRGVGGATLSQSTQRDISAGGNFSLRAVTTALNQGIESDFTFGMVVGRTYHIKARVFSVNGPVRLRLTAPDSLALEDGISERYTDPLLVDTSSTNVWETLETVFTPVRDTDGHRLQFVSQVSGSNDFYLDHVAIKEITVNTLQQNRGDDLLQTNLQFHNADNSTEETRVGLTTKHIFNNGVYGGAVDPKNNKNTQRINFQYRPDSIKDANGNTTQMEWSSDGARLNKITDAQNSSTQFTYNQAGQQAGTLRSSTDAQGRKTVYLYASGVRHRSPYHILVTNGQDLIVNGDMELDSGWTAIAGAAPAINERSTAQVMTGTYARRVVANAVGKGIEGNAWNVVGGRTYIITAWVYAQLGQVKVSVTGTSLFDNVVSTVEGWQHVTLIGSTPSSITGAKLRFTLNQMPTMGDTEFFVDSVFIFDATTVLRWQQFDYDVDGFSLLEQTVKPTTPSQLLSKVTRTRYAPTAPLGSRRLIEKVTTWDTQFIAANNRTTTYFYDAAGRVVQVNQSNTFGGCDQSRTVFDPAGNVIASICNHDNPSGNHPATVAQAVALFSSAFPDKNQVTTHEYDALGRRTKTTVNAGASYAQTALTVYDSLNRVVRTIANYVPDAAIPNPYTAVQSAFSHGTDNTQNLVTDTAYNQRGMVRKQADVLGNVTLFGYDEAGRLVKTIQNANTPAYNNDYAGTGSDPLLANYTPISATDKDIITQNVYDANGNLVMTTDALGRNTVQVYDALNRVVKTVRNPKPTFNITLEPGDVSYNAINDPRSSSYSPSPDPDRDQIDVTEYDAMGRVARTQDMLQNWTLYGYDALGRQVRVIRNASNPAYDRLIDPTLSSYPISALADSDLVSDTVYDASGRVLYTTGNASLASPSGEKMWAAYDGLGRVVRTVANAVGNATDGGVNDPRSMENYVENSSADRDHISRTQYDSNGRVQWTQDALGRKTWYVYDSVGRQKKVIQNCTYVSGSPAPEDDTYLGQHAADTSKDVITKTTYDGQGRVSSTIDPRGNETRFEYDILGRRTKTTRNYMDGVYASTTSDENLIDTVSYDLAGRVTKTVDNAGNETLYLYDALGRRTTITANYQDGVYIAAQPDKDLISSTTYDKGGQVKTAYDTRGTQTTFDYDLAGRQRSIVQAAGTSLATSSYTCFDKAGRVLRVIQNYRPGAGDPLPDVQTNGVFAFNPATHGGAEDTNLITQYTLDKLGQQVQVTDPLGNITTIVYEKDGRVLQMTDTMGVVTAYRYDRVGRRLRVAQSYARGSLTDLSGWYWDDVVGQKKWKDGNNGAIGFGTSNDQNILAQAEYDKGGRMLSLRDPRGNKITYSFDLLDRRTGLTNPLNQTWTTAFEEIGTTYKAEQVTQTNPLGHAAQQVTDKLGRAKALNYLSESPKLTPDITWTYDAAGVRTKMTEVVGASTVRITNYTYDAARRLKSVGFDTTGDGTVDQTVNYDYDAGGLRTKLTLPDGKTVTYSYDAHGRLLSLTDWSTQTTRYAYDQVGRIAAAFKPNNLTSQYRYDAGSRLRHLRHSTGTRTLGDFRYSVDNRGNRVQVLETLPKPGSGSTTFAYNDPGLELVVGNWTDASPFKISTNFSAALGLTFAGTGDTTLRMGVGPDHGMYDIYLNGDLWQSVSGYAAAAGETTFTLPLREEGPHTLELRNRPEKDPRSTGFTIRFKSLVTAATSRQLEVRTTKYSYDALSRLLEAKRVPGQNANSSYYRLDKYLYDVAGNRLAYISGVNGGPPNPFDPAVENYTYDAANRMLTAGVRTLNYDTAGRMTSDGVTSYTWDRAGRLLTDNNAQIQHTYNGDGQRVQQVVAGVTSTYLLDVQPALYQVLAATVSSNTTRYIHGPTGVQSQQEPSGNWTFVFQDGLGSVRVVSDALASTLENRWYSPFSEIVERDGTPQTTFGYTGEPTDTNGLVHLRARYYNPALSVFPSLDPLEGDMGSPLSLDRYAYVMGNPVNWTDPSGECVDPVICTQSYILSNPAASIALGCVKRPPTQANGASTYTYARAAAALKAVELARTGSLMKNGYAFAASGTDSARFMSIALHEGGLPLTTSDPSGQNNVCNTSSSSAVGWCVQKVGSLLEANSVFKNHNQQISEYEKIDPTQDTGLIGYLLGNPAVLGKGITISGSKLNTAISTEDVFGKPIGSNANFVYQTDGLLTNMTDKYKYLAQNISNLGLGSYCAGDYIFTSGTRPHGFMITGFGPAIDCDSGRQLVGATEQVPYVADLPGVQSGLPRPFYCSRVGTGTRFFQHRWWYFLKVPDTITVDNNRLFTPDPLP